MTDYFSLLGEVRRPWLEPELLQEKFLRLSSQFHPDRIHNMGESERNAGHSRYVELNAAYQCLREPGKRLRHLLEVEGVAANRNVQEIPKDIADLFMEIGPCCREADLLIQRKNSITSPLLQVQWFEESQPCRDKLEQLRHKLDERAQSALHRVQVIDGQWKNEGEEESSRAALLKTLEKVSAQFSYFEKWRAQLQDRIMRLNL